MEALFRAFFASIPYEWHTNNEIANYEGYHASVVYSWFAGLGLDVVAEESTSRGRLDMAVRFNGAVYLFEFKVVPRGPTGAAMAQLRRRRYAEKYRAPGVSVHLIAVRVSFVLFWWTVYFPLADPRMTPFRRQSQRERGAPVRQKERLGRPGTLLTG